LHIGTQFLKIKGCVSIYPFHFKVQGSAEIRNVFDKALIEKNGHSGECAPAFYNKLLPCSVLVEINNEV